MTDKTHQDSAEHKTHTEPHKVDPGVAGLAHLTGLVDFLEKSGHRDMPEVAHARAYLTSLAPPKAESKAGS